MKRVVKAWVVAGPERPHKPRWYSLASTSRQSATAFLDYGNEGYSWKVWQEMGRKCIPVTISYDDGQPRKRRRGGK